MADMLKGLLGSRKFIVALLTAVMITLNRKLSLNLTENDLNNIVMILTVAIAGESAIDVTKALKAPAMIEAKASQGVPSTSGEPTPPDNSSGGGPKS